MKGRETSFVFLSSAAVLGLVSASPAFGDADAYYHIWMAKRLLADGPMRIFTRLPLTSLADHFADQHFLYHLALTPFVGLFGDFWGLKVATALFASLAMTAFLYLLKTLGVRRAWLWSLPLLFAPGFVFRLLLTKATALALTALFLFLAALKKERRAALFAIAFAYVWLHAGWPILIVVALVDALIRRSAKFLLAIFGGLSLGLVANPFFPQNLFFYREQIVQVAIVGGHAFGVLVGQEWYPADFGSLISGNFLIFLPFFVITAFTACAVMRTRPIRPEAVSSERRRAILFFVALAAIFLLMTLRQARHKEYFLPLLLAASALLGDTALAAIDVRVFSSGGEKWYKRFWPPILVAGFLGLAVFAGHEATVVQRVYSERNVWTRFVAVGSWMRAHLPEDAIVFQTAWDDTPYLLYRDDAQRYIAGLDPRFFSDKDHTKYWEWRDIGEGRRRAGLAALIEKDFDSRYVFLKRDKEPLRPLIEKDPSFERVYQDAEAEVWKAR